MSAAVASATERDDLQIIRALGGVEKGCWWNIASNALGTCSHARHIKMTTDASTNSALFLGTRATTKLPPLSPHEKLS
jgi:hypothetical protein